MLVRSKVNEYENLVTIFIEGEFSFGVIREFHDYYRDLNGFKFVIDLRKVNYIDSAGLGMLLNMHNYLGQRNGSICITNVLPQVKKILYISRFDRKFTIK